MKGKDKHPFGDLKGLSLVLSELTPFLLLTLFLLSSLPNYSSLMATALYSTHCRSLATSSSSSSLQPSPLSSNLAYLQRLTFSQRFLPSKVSLKSQPQTYQIPVLTQQQEGSLFFFDFSYTLLFVSLKFLTFSCGHFPFFLCCTAHEIRILRCESETFGMC